MKKPTKRLSRRSHSLGDALVLCKDDTYVYQNKNGDEESNTRAPNGTSRSLSPNHHSRQSNQIQTTLGQGIKSLSPGKWMKKFKANRSASTGSLLVGNHNSMNSGTEECENGACGESTSCRSNKINLLNHSQTAQHDSRGSRTLQQHDSSGTKKSVQLRVNGGLQPAKINAFSTTSIKADSKYALNGYSATTTCAMEELTAIQSQTEQQQGQQNTLDAINQNQEQVQNHDDEEDSSVCTQETTNVCDADTSILTAMVWKRKSGFSGKVKSGYVKATEKANELGMKSVSNFQKLTQSLNPNTYNSTATNNTNDSHRNTQSPTNANGDPVVQVSPSSIKIWEERRIVLEGGILMYYHKDADLSVIDVGDNDDNNNSPIHPSGHLNSSRAPLPFMSKNKNLAKLKHKFIEFSHGTFSMNNVNAHIHQNNTANNSGQIAENEQSNSKSNLISSNSAINTPRGLIDLVATGATASVTHFAQNSHAPTPFSLSISIKNEIKWVLCFRTSKELFCWLGALTDISLKQSMQLYEKDHGHGYHLGNESFNRGQFDRKQGKDNIESTPRRKTGLHDNGEEGESDGEERSDSERKEAADEVTPLLSPKPKFDIRQLDGCKPRLRSDGATGLGAMAIFNGTALTLSLMISNISTTVLMIQGLTNGLVWIYLTLSQEKNDYLDEAGDSVETTHSSSANAIKSSMKRPSYRFGIRGRSFSDLEVKEKPSFVEVSKDDPPEVKSDYPPYKPPVGETMIEFKNESEALNYDGNMIGYISAPSSLLQVRGSQYVTDRKKVQSPISLYELFKVDGFDSKEHLLDVGTKFERPRLTFDSPKGDWRAPDLLVISFALPTSPPKLGKASDNKGYIVVGYYKMREETRQILQIISKYSSLEQEQKLKELCSSDDDCVRINGVKLWEKWCRCAPTDQEMQKRLKFIPRGENLKEVGVPGWICKYNGKPMLIKRPGVTNFVYSHQDEDMIEIDVNMHPLPYMFRQAMTYLKEHYFQRIVMTFGFVIEGREIDELPEVLLGNPLQLPYVKPENVVKGSSVFERPNF